MAETPSGEIQGIGLTTFLQMVQTEKAACSLFVRADDREGVLYLQDGEIIDAEFGSLSGAEAAYELIALPDPVIRMEQGCSRTEDRIRMPLMQILMEGSRLLDERNMDRPPLEDFDAEAAIGVDENTIGAGEHTAAELKEAHFSEWMSLNSGPSTAPLGSSPPFPVDSPTESPEAKGEKGARRKRILSSAAKAKRKRIAVAVLVVLLVLSGGAGLFYWYGQYTESRAYKALMTSVGRLDAPEQKEILLLNYLEAYPSSRFRNEIRGSLASIRGEIVKRDHKAAIEELELLGYAPENLEDALRVLDSFLLRHPRGHLATDIRTRKKERLRKASLVLLSRIRASENSETTRLSIARKYEALFPRQKEAPEVRAFITAMAKKKLDELNRLSCSTEGGIRECIVKLDKFVALFPRHPEIEGLKARRPELLVQLRMQEIDREAREADTATAADILHYYIATHRIEKDPGVRDAIREQLPALRAMAQAEQDYEEIDKQISQGSLTLPVKISILEKYVEGNPPEPFKSWMDRKLRTLVSTRDRTQQARINARISRDESRRRAREQELASRRQAEKARLQTALLRSRTLLERLGSRFETNANDTVRDLKTGRMWSLADSFAYTGKQLTYREARAYARKSRIGGHADWRLPTPAELASLFKNPPYFPSATPQRWYWTREVLSKGYQNRVTVISAKPEPVLSKKGVSPDTYGYALLVRN